MNAQILYDFLDKKSKNGVYLENVQLFFGDACIDNCKWVESPGFTEYIEFIESDEVQSTQHLDEVEK